MNQGHKVVSLVDEPGTQLCVPGSKGHNRDTKLSVQPGTQSCVPVQPGTQSCVPGVQTNLSPHILPGTRDSNLYP